MTIDEPRNPHHAATLERDEDPSRFRPPEVKAAQRLAATVGTHLHPGWLTTACVEEIMRKVVAHRSFFRSVFDELDADPKRIADRDKVLRQQERQSYDHQDDILERLTYIETERDLLHGYLRRMGSPYAPPLADPDARGADEDDARISREQRDAAAADAMPRTA